MKKLYIFFFGLIAGVILAIIFFSHPKAKPGLIKSDGHLLGTVKISPDLGQNPPETMGAYDFTLTQKTPLKAQKKNSAGPWGIRGSGVRGIGHGLELWESYNGANRGDNRYHRPGRSESGYPVFGGVRGGNPGGKIMAGLYWG